MTADRKEELAQMCRLEIRRTATLIRMSMNDRDREIDEVIDSEVWAMIPRLRCKPLTEADLPLLRELVITEVGNSRHRIH